ncbi:MAG: hypothetical protein QOG30_36 [Acidimicrobiaceae bacterium]|jgi:Flp pilus assembly protein TadB
MRGVKREHRQTGVICGALCVVFGVGFVVLGDLTAALTTMAGGVVLLALVLRR